ncbi:MAG: hypothetical protein F6K37_22775 [Moorea sp. SIO4E2]|uniref:hypothetical protein n=1 Tax=Moorena sp. SIO4E2 TaxID=2607826 RepID=UPI0013B6E750|nr:hypothetical protein [Moorena sp. SIO4E2]NEQ08668.1 hypothetical protein [Moorena sp. SIO4E2]
MRLYSYRQCHVDVEEYFGPAHKKTVPLDIEPFTPKQLLTEDGIVFVEALINGCEALDLSITSGLKN